MAPHRIPLKAQLEQKEGQGHISARVRTHAAILQHSNTTNDKCEAIRTKQVRRDDESILQPLASSAIFQS